MSSKAEPGLPTVPNTVLGIENKMKKASWTIIKVFQTSRSAAPNSRCWLPICAISMATSEVMSCTPPLPPDPSAPTQLCGQWKIQTLHGKGGRGDNMVLQKVVD